VRKDKVETTPMVLRMESRREECWIQKRNCFWGGEFEMAVEGLAPLCEDVTDCDYEIAGERVVERKMMMGCGKRMWMVMKC